MLQKKNQEKYNQNLKKQLKVNSEENAALLQVNQNLSLRFDFAEQKKEELERLINQIRLDIVRINQERLEKKEELENEIFTKDMERMEIKIEVRTFKEQIEEEINELNN